jgi:octaprenyl-diphosphate synthase
MLGDIFYSKAFFELSKFDMDIAQTISNAVTKLSLGELLDVELAKEFNEDEEKYLYMIYLKTASLIEATAASAALISKKNKEDFALFGKNLGLAFQIVDDILDVTADEKTLGKPSFADYKEGKTTLPFIYAYKSLNKEDAKRFKSLFKKELSDDEIKWLKQKLNETKAIEKSRQKALALAKEVEDITKQNQKLSEILLQMIDRSY